MKKNRAIIGKNESAEREYLEYQTIKKQTYLNLLNYILKFVDVETINFDSETLLDDVKTQFLKVNRKSFPQIINDNKIFDLVDFDLNKLDRLINDYQRIKINWDCNTGKFEEIDFNFYAETKEELQRLNESNELKAVFNKHLEIMPMGIIPKQQIASAFKNIVYFNHITNKYDININYIKGFLK